MVAEDSTASLPLARAGADLCRAREALGKSRADIARATRIAERFVEAIDEGHYGELPGRPYALGFARAYARAVGLDVDAIAQRLREEMDADAELAAPAATAAYTPGDPTRLPGRIHLWLGGVGAVLAMIAGVVFWHSAYKPAGALPSLLPAPKPAAVPPVARRPTPVVGAAPAAIGAPGPVVFTAQADGLWVKFSDADGKQLMQKQMKRGESYTVPADAKGPTLWTGSPEALSITVNGRPVPPLDSKHETVRRAPVSAAALLARPPAPAPAVPPPPPSTVSH